VVQKAKLLIVDDEKHIRDLLELILSDAGYACVKVSNGSEALKILEKENFDMLITDIRMPGISGVDLIKRAMQIRPHIAAIVISAVAQVNIAVEALKSGAYDYMVKPVNDLNRLLLIIDRALELRRLKLENIRYQQRLEEMVHQRTKHVQELFFNSITALVQALEEKDGYTMGHSRQVAEISCMIGERMGLSGEHIAQLDLAGQLHDIGKIGIPDEILRKPGPLSPEEYEIVKSHPARSYRILRPLFEFKGSLDEITMNENGRAKEETLDIILHHHERFDGEGYPDGLKGEDIPLGARILAVADAYEAMTSKRAYRAPLAPDKAIREIQREAGIQFDPEVVENFLGIYKGERL
jgi:response regulator RpfG family c-di-GMP phosphodiesterase